MLDRIRESACRRVILGKSLLDESIIPSTSVRKIILSAFRAADIFPATVSAFIFSRAPSSPDFLVSSSPTGAMIGM